MDGPQAVISRQTSTRMRAQGYEDRGRLRCIKQVHKVTTVEQVFTSIASWAVVGEMDLKDFYWQVPWRSQSSEDKYRQGFLCVRTPVGTYVYMRDPQGLIGMTEIQDEVMDLVLGDLVANGQAFIKADNIYFGGRDAQEAALRLLHDHAQVQIS